MVYVPRDRQRAMAGIGEANSAIAKSEVRSRDPVARRLARKGLSASSGLVTSVTVLGDINIAITNPSALSVPMQTNGSVLKIATSGTALYTALALTGITVAVTDTGHDANGNVVQQSRTINMRANFLGPYNEATVYQPTPGEFYLKTDGYFFNQDSTWKTTITAVNFATGWLTGATAETFSGTVTRQDSLSYFPFPSKIITPPWRRHVAGSTSQVQVEVIHGYPQAGQMVACVEIWAEDSALATGPISRASTMTRSTDTPADATLKGYPVPIYEVSAATTGLTAGKCYWRYTVKPWIGPPVLSTVYGAAFPSINPTDGVPFCLDSNASHAPIFAILSNEQASAPGGKTLIATNTNVATVNVTGLSTTMVGALASNLVYADLGTLATAVRRLNKSASALTIADPVSGAASYSYARPTLHDDLSGGVAVCPAVAGSVLGADAGAYSIWQVVSSQASYPPGLTAFEIRSETGLPSEDVRWRGEHSDGSALSATSRTIPSRTRLRGITCDSTGITTAANNTVFSGAAPTTVLTETTAVYCEQIDTVYRDTTSVVASASLLHYQAGLVWDIRHEHHNPSLATGISQGANNVTAGLVASIGSYYNHDTSASILVEFSAVLGGKLRNIAGAAPSSTAQTRPNLKGRIFFNVEGFSSLSGNANSLFSSGGFSYPIVGGEGFANVLAWSDQVSAPTGAGVALTNDQAKYEVDGLYVHGLTSVWPNAASATTGRANIGYQDVGFQRINKRVLLNSWFARNTATKGDPFIDPLTPTTGGVAHNSANAYYKGAIVQTGGFGYQAIRDVPVSTSISDTSYWALFGTATTAFGPQPLRQGNNDLRYHIDCHAAVSCGTALGPTPDATSWFGIAWGPNEKYDATFSNCFNNLAGSDFTPKPAGDLIGRAPVPYAPFDLYGVTIPTDGTAAAGALQIP